MRLPPNLSSDCVKAYGGVGYVIRDPEKPPNPADRLELLVMVFGKRYVKGITYAIIIKTQLHTQMGTWQQ